MARKVKYDAMIGIEDEKPEQRNISSNELFQRWAAVRDVWTELYGQHYRYEWDMNTRNARIEALFLSHLETITREDIEQAIQKFIFGDGEKYYGDDDAYFDAFGKEREYPPEPQQIGLRAAARRKRRTKKAPQQIAWII